MGDRLFGMLIGVILGVVPGVAILLIAAAVTDDFADQAGIGVGLLAIFLIFLGGIGGLIVGAITVPQVRGQFLAGLVLGALPGLALWVVFDALNTFKRPCGARTQNCGFIATGGTGAEFKTIRFRFAPGAFARGERFEFDADTDGGLGVDGASMRGMKVTVRTATKTYRGVLERTGPRTSMVGL